LNVEKERKDRIIQEKEKRKEQRELDDCTFKPQIKYHPAHEQYDDAPIWDRLHEEPIGFSPEEPTGAEEETFQPQINEVSEKLTANGRDNTEEIHERLYNIDLKERDRKREEEKKKRELRDCTFKPEKNSSKNKEINVRSTNDANVFERLLTTDTASGTSRKAKTPVDVQSNTIPSKKSASKSSAGGLSFLERMALASKKQKSTPRGRASQAKSARVVRSVPRPVKPPPEHTTLDSSASDSANAPHLPQSTTSTNDESDFGAQQESEMTHSGDSQQNHGSSDDEYLVNDDNEDDGDSQTDGDHVALEF
jgi:hypothetical protein